MLQMRALSGAMTAPSLPLKPVACIRRPVLVCSSDSQRLQSSASSNATSPEAVAREKGSGTPSTSSTPGVVIVPPPNGANGAFGATISSLAPKEPLPLKPAMQGYHSISLQGVDFLISTTEDGFLDLNDAFYLEDGKTDYQRPKSRGELPKVRARYQELPWHTFVSGNVFNYKEQSFKVMKVLLVKIGSATGAADDEYRLDLEECYVVDSEAKEIFKPQVEKVGEPEYPILRFRRDRVVIEDEQAAPHWSAVANEGRMGVKSDKWWDRNAAAAAKAASDAATANAALAAQAAIRNAAMSGEDEVDLDSIGDDSEAFDEDMFGEFEQEEMEEGDDGGGGGGDY